MPRKYPDEFRARVVALVRSGQTVTKTAEDLGITDSCLYGWVKQDRIDRGKIEGVSRTEFRELRTAKRRIRELEDEVEILRRGNAMLGSPARHPKESTRDRRSRRRRVHRQDLLPRPRRVSTGLLPVSASPDVRNDDAPRVAHCGDPAGAC